MQADVQYVTVHSDENIQTYLLVAGQRGYIARGYVRYELGFIESQGLNGMEPSEHLMKGGRACRCVLDLSLMRKEPCLPAGEEQREYDTYYPGDGYQSIHGLSPPRWSACSWCGQVIETIGRVGMMTIMSYIDAAR